MLEVVLQQQHHLRDMHTLEPRTVHPALYNFIILLQVQVHQMGS